MNPNEFDMYYSNTANRSPNSQRLNRQTSRQHVEPQAYLPSGLYQDAYGGGDRFGDMRNATIGGYGGSFDMGGGSWNNGAYGQNNTINGMGGHGMRRPQSKGRSGLPTVSPNSYLLGRPSLMFQPVMARSAASASKPIPWRACGISRDAPGHVPGSR